MATEGNVHNRTLFYERILDSSNGNHRVRFLPFYLVTIPDLGGRIFEPVDYLPAITNKDITEMREHDPRAKFGCCESIEPDMQLHSFGGWEYPPV